MPRELRERLILNVAGQVFARDGYHSASMDVIAELADVSKPMIYAYFGSKERLYVAYVDRTGRELLDRLVRAARREDHPVTALRARIGQFLAFVEEYRDGWRVLFNEARSSAPVAEEVSDLRAQITQAIRRLLEESGRHPGLAPPASDAVAHAIVGAGESLANWWLVHPEVSCDAVAEWYLGLVQAAIVSARASSR